MSQTILLTGITGFIAKRIAVDLLNAGYTVRGTLRNLDRIQEVKEALKPHITDRAALTRLSFATLDLTEDTGWNAAMSGIDALIHTASPFPDAAPKDENDLIRPAVDGALRALRAAQTAGVTRVVMTSSIVAMIQREMANGDTITPDLWSDLDHASITAYAKSKTLAEKAAWDFVSKHPEMQLTTINPGLVIGAPLDQHYGTSLKIIKQMVSGKLPVIPNFGLALVDIDDVSKAHVAALSAPKSIGQRFVLVSDYLLAKDLVAHLKKIAPSAKLPRVAVPKFAARLIGLASTQVRSLVPMIDKQFEVDNSATRNILGVAFTPRQTSLAATVAALTTTSSG